MYILNINYKILFYKAGSDILHKKIFDFPFNLNGKQNLPDENLLLEKLFLSIQKNRDKSKNSFLFHSSGKDSNLLALAIMESGYQKDYYLTSSYSPGESDESLYSKNFAKKYGFKSITLKPPSWNKREKEFMVKSYFEKSPFPSTDQVTLAYPGFLFHNPQLCHSNIIDGMGNDVYLGHMPTKDEYFRQKFFDYSSNLGKIINNYVKSEGLLNVLRRTRQENTGISGLSKYDLQKIFRFKINTLDFSIFSNDLDYILMRGKIRGGIIDQEIFIRKVRNFASVSESNLILPWCDKDIANLFINVSSDKLFNRNIFKNKLMLRKILQDKIKNYDDSKKAFAFDLKNFFSGNIDFVEDEILSCRFFHKPYIKSMLKRLKIAINQNNGKSFKSVNILNRIFTISSWLNNCKFLNQ